MVALVIDNEVIDCPFVDGQEPEDDLSSIDQLNMHIKECLKRIEALEKKFKEHYL